MLTIQGKLELAGITLFGRKGEDIVGLYSTDLKEIGFSSRECGFYETIDIFIRDSEVDVEGATLLDKNVIMLPIAQSGSHQGEPVFFKYGYYHPPGSSYIINPYVEVDEVEKFLDEVGPISSIMQMKVDNPYLKEVAIVDPKVFVDPSLENELYPP